MIEFVRETQGLDFVGAIEWLGDRFRIAARVRGVLAAKRTRARQRRTRLYALLEHAASLLRALPLGLAGGRRRARLPRRARPRARRSAASSGSGSRSAAATLTRKALEKGFTPDELRAAGLTRAARRRLLRAPARVPARGCPRARARVPGAPLCTRTIRCEAKYVNTPGVGALPQGRRRLRARQGACGDREARTAPASSRGTPT